MNLFKTTAEEVAKEHLGIARHHAVKARQVLDEIILAMDRHETSETKSLDAFDVNWINMLNREVFGMSNEIGRANGAVLVRRKD